ncbi:MAG: hypothetical protein NTZ49_04910 [Candidatus Parcubacteria bacterium]|nr:hypothetical protein [Candidatus Parcubacteria bacterium]
MEMQKYARAWANLKKYEKDFPWLWRIIAKWHPGFVEINVCYMDYERWDNPWNHFQNWTAERRIWFKIKNQSNFTYEEVIEVTPEKGRYSLQELKTRYHQMSDVNGIEYIIVVEDIPNSERKIISIFRPPKPKKVF